MDRNDGNNETIWQDILTLREQTGSKLHLIKRVINLDSRLKANYGYKFLSWQEIWDDCDDLVKLMADPAERDPELISDLFVDLQELDDELTPIADQFEHQSKPTPSEKKEENAQDARTEKNKRIGRLNSVKVAAKNALLITDTDIYLSQEQIELLDAAQKTMNDLYRKEAKYGDGSSAFMVLVEQAAGGVGGEAQAIVADTIHKAKCQEYIVGLGHKLDETRMPHGDLPQQAKDRIRAEISKMQDAIDWAEKYGAGHSPKIPSWARPWKSQIEKYMY